MNMANLKKQEDTKLPTSFQNNSSLIEENIKRRHKLGKVDADLGNEVLKYQQQQFKKHQERQEEDILDRALKADMD